MQIDVISGASVAPENESSASPPEAGKARGSFADLLDAVAEDQNQPATAEENDEDDLTGDEWMTVPVVVPFAPVIPQDVVKAEDGDATSVEAIGEDLAAAGAEAAQPEVAALPDANPIVDGEIPKPVEAKPQSEATMGESPAGDGRVVAESNVQTIAAAAVSEPGTAAVVDAKASTPTDAAPKPEKPVKAAAQKTPGANDVSKVAAAESTVNSAIQSAVTERVASTDEASPKNATNEPVAAVKGVAARFARALERATEQAIAPTAQSGENHQAANQNSGDQPSFGEWLREQLPQLNASRGHNNAGGAAFSFVAPVQNDARVSGLLAASGPTLPGNTPALPNEHDVNLQILQSMRMQFRDGIGEAVLKLKPEHLGSVSISLKVENGGLKANVQADMPAVRQWLESQQDTLRSALSEHGLRLDQFDVEPDAQRQQADEEGRREQSRKRHAQKREAEQPVFEVVV
jgi:flagellar hook-length control protein FliK